MLEFKATQEQSNEIRALAYWVSDDYYIREKSGINDPERQTAKNTVLFTFKKLDELRVPYWVQNTVIAFCENWRNYAGGGLANHLKKRNIYLQ